MEIIARLREERASLVARVSQIDKMLQQYEEWGREAQRLLSLTGTVKTDSAEDRAAPTDLLAGEVSETSDQPEYRQPGNIRIQARSSFSVAGRKTPIPEFEAAVIDVLRESGQPMDRVALYNALTVRGVVIGHGGRDKDMNALSARIYRMARDPKNGISGERGKGYQLIADDEVAGSDATGEASVDLLDDGNLI